MNSPNLWLYSSLSRLQQPKSYKGKIMLVAFVGTHIPLLTLLLYFLISNSFSLEMTIRVLVIALVATLVGTGCTLCALHHLLLPVSLTSRALQSYLREKKLPQLPTQFTDEAGTLMTDTVQTIKKLDVVIQRLTDYDDLTDLPNRDLFRNYCQKTLINLPNDKHLFAVIALNINNFRSINNTLGARIGDLLLKAVAERLVTNGGQNNYVCRLGNDEFAIAISHLTTIEAVTERAETLLKTLLPAFILEGKEIYISASLGIAVSPNDGSHIDSLLQNATTALNQPQRCEPNRYQFYGSEMNAQLQKRLLMENQLRQALERGEFFLHYQPRVKAHTGQVVAVEALLRWHNPILGMVSPAVFIPIAEANGLIGEIGEWALYIACAQNKAWQSAGLPPIRMSVNLSAQQVKQPNLAEQVSQILEKTGLDVAYLELEVTESLMMENVQQALATLQQLHELGIMLALDDFGTGYSSLSYLRHFPIDTLKIDRSFVTDVVTNLDNSAITNAIIALAKSLYLNITAEGVETQEQLEYLQAQGCHEIQGYYFSPPIPAEAIADFLQPPPLPLSDNSQEYNQRSLTHITPTPISQLVHYHSPD
ncbi:MAG: EAL domain-containing protein [Kastovskya adunca ATA6-11-RM4]|jgi:diguanylate cyclase (GGDEF)-like protein|nr:EAL domain-containing protein [Kastovskya adunca ATA6-11-RM4]